MNVRVRVDASDLEAVGRYKGMSQCATRPVEWSGIKEASSRRPALAYGLRTRRRHTPTPSRSLERETPLPEGDEQ